MNASRWLLRSLKKRGLLKTIKLTYSVAADFSFDWRHQTETMQWVQADAFHTPSHNKAYATNYQATRVRPLVRLLRRLQLAKEGTFIDLGCGKGRVLMIASEFGFRRVVGVEFCDQLCQQARANAKLFRQRNPLSPPIEIIESDVTQFQFRGDETVFFLYNPFTPVVLSQTLQNIALSVSAVPREIWLIYNTPLHHDTICEEGRFERSELFEIEGTEFRVYSHFNAAIPKVRSLP